MGLAGLYVFLMADFIAAVQIVIYVGGILVLLIFAIMLTQKITTIQISHSSLQRGVGGLVVALIFAGLVKMILSAPWHLEKGVDPEGTTAGIGKLLMIDYLIPFEVASILLLSALLGGRHASLEGADSGQFGYLSCHRCRPVQFRAVRGDHP